jgi:hypothetical protein
LSQEDFLYSNGNPGNQSVISQRKLTFSNELINQYQSDYHNQQAVTSTNISTLKANKMYGSSDNNHQIENSINDFTNHKKTYNLIESSYFKKHIQSS